MSSADTHPQMEVLSDHSRSESTIIYHSAIAAATNSALANQLDTDTLTPGMASMILDQNERLIALLSDLVERKDAADRVERERRQRDKDNKGKRGSVRFVDPRPVSMPLPQSLSVTAASPTAQQRRQHRVGSFYRRMVDRVTVKFHKHKGKTLKREAGKDTAASTLDKEDFLRWVRWKFEIAFDDGS